MPSPKAAPSSKTTPKPPRFIERSEMNELEEAIRRRIAERAYSFFDLSGRVHGHDLEHWAQAEAEVVHRGIDIRESGSWLALKASLPGVSAEDVHIYVESRRVVIRAMQRADVEQPESQRSTAETFLVADLNLEADPGTASATLKDQQLTLMVQKRHPTAESQTQAGAS